MKKKIYYILFFVFMCIFPLNVRADYDAVINGNTVRIRKGASTSYEIIATVNVNTNLSVVDKTLVTGKGCSAGWYKVKYNDKDGYVCSTYVTFVDTSFSGINVVDWAYRVNANNVSVRKGASTSYATTDTLTLGANVSVLDTVNGSTSNCSGGKWYKIRYYTNSEGYMCAKYITKKSDISASNDEYTKILKEAGFPDSYIPYLTYLHNKYPNWTFKPSITNLDFTTSVNSEAGKCYMQTKNNNYRTSTNPAEGSSWFKVNTGVISFYMDPRNWLDEKRIFMFEKLDYSNELESTYPSLVKAIFGSGDLGDDKYTIPMVNAGKAKSISPVHIASRIRLEVGADGSGSTSGKEFTWKGKTYSGYYNFFNIGAYETTVDGVKYSAVTRGLAYAAKLINRDGELWNNIETSITEGSSFLANGYVTKGQGTLYYQKFNTGPNAYYSKYTHQYMTNIQAPATEGNSSYNSYNSAGVVASPFIFEIPVYKNMPSYTSLPNSGDTNNSLSSLSIEGYSISPSFDDDILTYTAYVPLKTDKIKVNATAVSSLSTISGIGEIELPSNENIVSIIVTSQSGLSKKYTLTIQKVENTNTVETVINNSNYKTVDSVITKIKSNTTVDAIQNNMIKGGATSVVISNPSGTTISRSNKITTNSKVTITASNGSKIYTISVVGDTSGDGVITILDLLQVQKHIKKSSALSGAAFLAADTSGDGAVTILDLLQVQKHIKGDSSL